MEGDLLLKGGGAAAVLLGPAEAGPARPAEMALPRVPYGVPLVLAAGAAEPLACANSPASADSSQALASCLSVMG
ncbi:hypothetical protein [Nonomuraea recticatena]